MYVSHDLIVSTVFIIIPSFMSTSSHSSHQQERPHADPALSTQLILILLAVIIILLVLLLLLLLLV